MDEKMFRFILNDVLDTKLEENNKMLEKRLELKLELKLEQKLDEKLDEKLDQKFKENNEKLQAKILNIINLNNDDILMRVDKMITERFKIELAPINALLVSHDLKIKNLEEKVYSD